MKRLPARPNVLYVDPPWSFDTVTTGGGKRTSGAASKYTTIDIDGLVDVANRFQRILANDAVVALWATTAMKPEAMELLQAFGMEYKTSFYWIKTYGGRKMGLGAWNRGGVEELLVGKRGKARAWRLQIPAWRAHAALQHSRKPAIFRDMVWRGTQHMPDPRRVELFARRRAKGWAATGLELDGKDIRDLVKTWPTSA